MLVVVVHLRDIALVGNAIGKRHEQAAHGLDLVGLLGPEPDDLLEVIDGKRAVNLEVAVGKLDDLLFLVVVIVLVIDTAHDLLEHI